MSYKAVPSIRGESVIGKKEIAIFTQGSIRIKASDVRIVK